jgi:hypothetical protein
MCIGDAQLGTGMGPFPAGDLPHPGRQPRKVAGSQRVCSATRAPSRARPSDRGDPRARVITERMDEPTHRRIRGHHTEQFRLSPHQRRIRQTVTTKGYRDGQIRHRLTRIVDRTHRSPGLQCRGELLSKTADLRSLQQQ